MQIEKNIYLTKNEKNEIKENQMLFNSELRKNILAKLDEIRERAIKDKKVHVYVLITSRVKPILKHIEIVDNFEIMNEVELKYIIFDSRPWPFLNSMCIRLDTLNGTARMEYSLPDVHLYKQVIEGKIEVDAIIYESCMELKRFREEHGTIPMSTHEEVNNVDWQKVERLMEDEVRERIISHEEKQKTDNP